jgi:hypothetical protein
VLIVLEPLFDDYPDRSVCEAAPDPLIPHLGRWLLEDLVTDRALDLESQGVVIPGELVRNVGLTEGQTVS